MTITNRIKQELFNADIDYQYQLDSFRSQYPNGVNFCYETVSSKAAVAAEMLYKAESAFNALVMLVTPKFEHSVMEETTHRLIEQYNNAETEEELNAAEKEYYSLYTIRA